MLAMPCSTCSLPKATAALLLAVALLSGIAAATEHHVKVDNVGGPMARGGKASRALLLTVGAIDFALLSLTCPSSSVVVTINNAYYGTADGSCQSNQAANLINNLRLMCSGLPSCDFVVNKTTLDQLQVADPCFGVPKEMTVDYTCGPGAIDFQTLSLACPSGLVVSSVTKTSYGAASIWCQTSQAQTLTSAMNNFCVGQPTCNIPVTPASLDSFGIADPCFGTVKTMAADFTCSPQAGTASANDFQTLSLACPSGTVVSAVIQTTYGAPGTSCQTSQAQTLTSAMNSFCVGKATCNIPVTEASLNSFGIVDPCFGTAKTMTADFTCSPQQQAGIFFSPYKDITVNMNWNTYAISTKVTGQSQSVLQVMPSGLTAVTWAFATGECGSENWAGVTPSQVATNVQAWVQAGRKYIISTGGEAGSFTCGTDAGFATFLSTYMSASLVGIDFDVENSATQTDVNNLVQRVKVAQLIYPNLRFSFTVPTLGGNQGDNLPAGEYGQMILAAINAAGLNWNNLFINLMVMDYGDVDPYVCAVSGGLCDMGQSAINAAESLRTYHPEVPYSSIELTPMIGRNDVADEVFTLADVATVAAYAVNKGLGGVHFWSFDRDVDCTSQVASSTCNSYGQAGTFGFTNTFLSNL